MCKTIGIIFLGDFFTDGRCMNMANTILDSGNKLFVIDANPSGENKYREANIFHIDLSFKQSGPLRYWKFHKEVINKLHNQKFDTLISGDLFSLGALSKFRHSTKIVFDSREIYSQLGALANKPIYQFFWSQFEKHFIKICDAVIVTAKSDGVYLKSIYPKIPNPIVLKNLPSSKMLDIPGFDLRKKFNISEKQKIFLYQGVIQYGRGLKIMIDLLEHFPNYVCVFIGNGDFTQNIKDYAFQKNCSDRVFFTGAVPYNKLLSYTKSADIGFSLIEPISKSYVHALPNKLYEYFLVGIPVVASDFPEMKKAINNYPSGLVVDPSNIYQIVKTTSNLLNIPYNREANQKFALENCVWETQKTTLLDTL